MPPGTSSLATGQSCFLYREVPSDKQLPSQITQETEKKTRNKVSEAGILIFEKIFSL